MHTIEEHNDPDRWGFVIKDGNGKAVKYIAHSHDEPKTEETRESARKLAEAHKTVLDAEAPKYGRI